MMPESCLYEPKQLKFKAYITRDYHSAVLKISPLGSLFEVDVSSAHLSPSDEPHSSAA